jgi:hypothetical protein
MSCHYLYFVADISVMSLVLPHSKSNKTISTMYFLHLVIVVYWIVYWIVFYILEYI